MKTVLLKIESLIEDLDGVGLTESSERCEDTYTAEAEEAGGRLSLRYTEENENGKINAIIEIEGESVTVRRTGALTSCFIFTEGKLQKSLYTAAGYSFDTEIFTKKIRNNLTRGGGMLTIFYNMTVGGAQKRVRMKISVCGGEG